MAKPRRLQPVFAQKRQKRAVSASCPHIKRRDFEGISNISLALIKKVFYNEVLALKSMYIIIWLKY
jgi:hypothetical protein